MPTENATSSVTVEQQHQNALNAAERGDFKEAFDIWLPLAENGSDVAQYNVGILCDRGLGVSQNSAEAVRWYTKAAEQGFARAEHDLGQMIRQGLGIQADAAQAVYWFKSAAEKGYAPAQQMLGVMYFDGMGVAQNYSEAALWNQKAAAQRNADAMGNLGVSYAMGLGVAQDFGMAFMWLTLAHECGDDSVRTNAKKGLDAIARKMSKAEQFRGNALVINWIEQNAPGDLAK